MELRAPKVYRFATFDGPENLKEAACRLAFDKEPQAGYVFCSVADYVESGMKADKAKIANAWEPGTFFLMPDIFVPRGHLHACNPDEGFAGSDIEYRQTEIRR